MSARHLRNSEHSQVPNKIKIGKLETKLGEMGPV
jgi:hypothetical protein